MNTTAHGRDRGLLAKPNEPIISQHNKYTALLYAIKHVYIVKITDYIFL